MSNLIPDFMRNICVQWIVAILLDLVAVWVAVRARAGNGSRFEEMVAWPLLMIAFAVTVGVILGFAYSVAGGWNTGLSGLSGG